jgi:hypothetical protein
VQGRELAQRLDMENDLTAVKGIIVFVREYGLENSARAVDELARYGNENPLKNIGYLHGIVKRIASGAK